MKIYYTVHGNVCFLKSGAVSVVLNSDASQYYKILDYYKK